MNGPKVFSFANIVKYGQMGEKMGKNSLCDNENGKYGVGSTIEGKGVEGERGINGAQNGEEC